ncbi:hypothetical protein PR202_ga26317 [Eleusine coracana subsp. coracana]|uniref:GTD-binding domain-containing protein n=1 Tax=Eleusine coracana subsp. coracana TaxID=191504 RepID=A0AAV5DDJ1_ELECO|nr:hypothetical protein PR202_ga26317 [Eleusine coracana subsp. coracana]
MAASASAGKLLAAALHRRTHRVTSALAHAALEWVLIALLLINGVLAYAIARFADYFGLAPPCLLCSRVDRLFQADGCARRLRDVLCGEHAAEISALGYCLSHRRLAEACAMCEACLSSLKEVSSEAGEKGRRRGVFLLRSCLVRNSPRELQGTRKRLRPREDTRGGGGRRRPGAYAPLAQDELEDEEQEEVVEFPQERDEVEGQEEHEEKAVAVEDGSLEAMAQGEEIAPEDDRLVPVVALDEMTIADESAPSLIQSMQPMVPMKIPFSMWKIVLKSEIPLLKKHVAVPQVTEAVPEEDDNTAAEVDTNCEVSIGSEICEHESAAVDEQDAPSAVFQTKSRQHSKASMMHSQMSKNETEEDKAPETPTYGVATPRSDRMFLLERKRSLSLSLDGSVASEMDGAEPSSVDQLKSALQAERKALSALYAELEEERNAAAIATNQTMAMINRLQEEKAAMQMEALQYQRMMEEQSEYDQEALQLMNELVTKREREKQELERELELYRHKLQHYEDIRIGGGWQASRLMGSVSVPVAVELLCRPAVRTATKPSDCELGESPDGGNLQSSSDAVLTPVTRSGRHESPSGFGRLLDVLRDGAAVHLGGSSRHWRRGSSHWKTTTSTRPMRPLTIPPKILTCQRLVSGLLQNMVSPVTRRSLEAGLPFAEGKSLLPLFDAAAGDDNCDQVTSARVAEADADDSTTKVSFSAGERSRRGWRL